MTSDTPFPRLRTADRTEPDSVLDVLVEALRDDPVSCWLFPSPGTRGFRQRAFLSALLSEFPVETDLIGVDGRSDDGALVRIWLAAGQQPFDEPGDTGGAVPEPAAAIFGDDYQRVQALGRLVAVRHPIGQAHLYLACLGVVPARRNAGLGTALLRSGLARADADGVPAYLEASSDRSRDLYLRHGFADHGGPVRLPDGPRVWPMVRPARSVER